MKQVFYLLLALLCFQVAAAQQTSEIATIVIDSINQTKMINASIIITRSSDSMIVVSGRTQPGGYCTFTLRDTGTYQLYVLYPGYVDYYKEFYISEHQNRKIFRPSLLPVAHVLEEVVVKNEVKKIKIKGDTIEYRADSFLTDLNATVEDLIKKLPGLSVDERGIIRAQGKRIEKILIGGEEYFSEDPTLVTRSLRSNMIQKVQLFDKKSDQAGFSKFNDSKSVKAINLELKPDKKRGYFGKAEKGISFSQYYNNQILANYFNDNRKVAVYFVLSNTGVTGLSWQDTRTYSDLSLNSQESSGLTSSRTSSLENWDGTFQNQGIPLVSAGGLHYSDKYSNLFSFNSNLKHYNIKLNVKTISDQQFIVNGSQYLRKIQSSINNHASSNRGILKTTLKLAQNSELLIGLDLNVGNKTIENAISSSLALDTLQNLNTQSRTLKIKGAEKNLIASLLWRVKTHSGSTFSINGKIIANSNHFDGFIYSQDSVFKNNFFSKDSVTDQYKDDQFYNTAYNLKSVYSIPIDLFSTIQVSAGYTHNFSRNRIKSFNRNSTGQYILEDGSYTNQYNLIGQNILLGLGYNYSSGKSMLTTMIDGGLSSLSQETIGQPRLSKSFPMLFPSMTLTYSFNQQHKLIIDYTGTTILPQIRQLQPVLTNLDPLNLVIGNPNLSAAFRNTITLQYYNFNSSTDAFISGGGTFSFDHNGFSSIENMDQFGKTIYSMTNGASNKKFSLFSYYTCKLFRKKLDLNLALTANGSEHFRQINGFQINTQSVDYGLTISPSLYRQDKINIEFKSGVRWNRINTNGSLKSAKQVYTILLLQPSISVNIRKYTTLKADYSLSRYPVNTIYGASETISILNASLSQQMLKGKSLTLKLYVRDLFNTNTGLSRNVFDNYISQTSFNTISRYFLLSLIYNFSHTLKTK
ncbi:MAG: outer membrane beta-barrel protein [Sediminibacterium sp.]|nr:outer membrane beta-barrel protein [Sediminibacterium sp.]